MGGLDRGGRPVLWEELTWEGVAALRAAGCDMVIVPVGATEQHGRHLPLCVDTISAEAVAHEVSRRTGVPVLPVIAYGCSLGHSTRWPGTISLRPETLSRIVLDIAEWVQAAGFRRVLILNGHYTNWAPLRVALETIRHERPEMRLAIRSLWDIDAEVGRLYSQDAANFHANHAETSLMLALRPELVWMEHARAEPDRSAGRFFTYRVDQESEHGTVGDPTTATAAFGRELLARMVDALSEQVTAAVREEPPLGD
jgi:creatinine amidohydrolase